MISQVTLNNEQMRSALHHLSTLMEDEREADLRVNAVSQFLAPSQYSSNQDSQSNRNLKYSTSSNNSSAIPGLTSPSHQSSRSPFQRTGSRSPLRQINIPPSPQYSSIQSQQFSSVKSSTQSVRLFPSAKKQRSIFAEHTNTIDESPSIETTRTNESTYIQQIKELVERSQQYDSNQPQQSVINNTSLTAPLSPSSQTFQSSFEQSEQIPSVINNQPTKPVWERLVQLGKDQKQRLQSIRVAESIQQSHQIKKESHVPMNPQSEHILKQRSEQYTSASKNWRALAKNKADKLDQYKQIKEEKEQQLQSQIAKNQSKASSLVEANAVIQRLQKWQTQRDRKIDQQRQEQNKKKRHFEQSEFTFTPTINNYNSSASQYSKNENIDDDVVDRLYRRQEDVEKKKQEKLSQVFRIQYPFQPFTNPSSIKSSTTSTRISFFTQHDATPIATPQHRSKSPMQSKVQIIYSQCNGLLINVHRTRRSTTPNQTARATTPNIKGNQETEIPPKLPKRDNSMIGFSRTISPMPRNTRSVTPNNQRQKDPNFSQASKQTQQHHESLVTSVITPKKAKTSNPIDFDAQLRILQSNQFFLSPLATKQRDDTYPFSSVNVNSVQVTFDRSTSPVEKGTQRSKSPISRRKPFTKIIRSEDDDFHEQLESLLSMISQKTTTTNTNAR